MFQSIWKGVLFSLATISVIVLLAAPSFATPAGGRIAGIKFYDTNADGAFDLTEPPVGGFRIKLTDVDTGVVTYTTTAADGSFEFLGNDVGTYLVEEVIPLGGATWIRTGPPDTDFRNLVISDGVYTEVLIINQRTGEVTNRRENYFWNVCLGVGGGLTKGFWGNKNGQALIGADDLTFVNGLLPYQTSSEYSNLTPFANKTAIKNYLQAATATNMRYMLAAQLLAMELNVYNGKVSGSSILYVGQDSNDMPIFQTVSSVMSNAITAWASSGGACEAGCPQRAEQEFYKNALDNANNNINFVQAQACTVIYTSTQPAGS